MGTRLQDESEARKLADTILTLIEEQNLTRADLKRKTGMASTTLYDKLSARPGHFTVDELGRIARALGVTLAHLLGLEA